MDERLYPPVHITLDTTGIAVVEAAMPGRVWEWFGTIQRARGVRRVLGDANSGDAIELPGLPPSLRLRVVSKTWSLDESGASSFRVTLGKA